MEKRNTIHMLLIAAIAFFCTSMRAMHTSGLVGGDYDEKLNSAVMPVKEIQDKHDNEDGKKLTELLEKNTPIKTGMNGVQLIILFPRNLLTDC